MSLSDAFWIAAAFAVICAYYIGEKIIDIDFSCFLAKNRKKAKYERLLAKRETPLANMGLRRNIRNAYENVLCPLAKADKSLLPIRMDKTFRRNIELQIDSLAFTVTSAWLTSVRDRKSGSGHGRTTAGNGVKPSLSAAHLSA